MGEVVLRGHWLREVLRDVDHVGRRGHSEMMWCEVRYEVDD